MVNNFTQMTDFLKQGINWQCWHVDATNASGSGVWLLDVCVHVDLRWWIVISDDVSCLSGRCGCCCCGVVMMMMKSSDSWEIARVVGAARVRRRAHLEVRLETAASTGPRVRVGGVRRQAVGGRVVSVWGEAGDQWPPAGAGGSGGTLVGGRADHTRRSTCRWRTHVASRTSAATRHWLVELGQVVSCRSWWWWWRGCWWRLIAWTRYTHSQFVITISSSIL